VNETPIKSVFIYNHNPVAVHPQQRAMHEALLSEDLFVVGSDISMTDSMACADVILPAATHLEYGDLYKAYGHHYLQRSEAVIAPVEQALPNTEIFRRLAARFGFDEACFSDTDDELVDMALEEKVAAMRGLKATDIPVTQAIDMSLDSHSGLLRGADPTTPSGKIELFSEALERECGQGLPQYRELESDRRFTLVSPSSEKRTNSTFGGIDDHDSDMCVEINSEDAISLALREGQSVRLFNDLGEVNLPVNINDRVRRDTVYVPKGAWIKNSPTGQTINALVPGHRADIAGGACYNDARVDIEAIAARGAAS
jgi:anaerobic selenocysteine-containing dehydrogenase